MKEVVLGPATNGKPFTGNTVRGILHRQKKRWKEVIWP